MVAIITQRTLTELLRLSRPRYTSRTFLVAKYVATSTLEGWHISSQYRFVNQRVRTHLAACIFYKFNAAMSDETSHDDRQADTHCNDTPASTLQSSLHSAFGNEAFLAVSADTLQKYGNCIDFKNFLKTNSTSVHQLQAYLQSRQGYPLLPGSGICHHGESPFGNLGHELLSDPANVNCETKPSEPNAPFPASRQGDSDSLDDHFAGILKRWTELKINDAREEQAHLVEMATGGPAKRRPAKAKLVYGDGQRLREATGSSGKCMMPGLPGILVACLPLTYPFSTQTTLPRMSGQPTLARNSRSQVPRSWPWPTG